MIELRDIVNERTGAVWSYRPFSEACRRVVERGEWATFRQDEAIANVVEPVSEAVGISCAATIAVKFAARWDDVAAIANDTVGGPAIVEFDGVEHAPATWRYILRALELGAAFGTLDGLTIVEVGGGYGGLAAVIVQLFEPAAYAIYDAAEVSMLQAGYLAALGIFDVATISEMPAEPVKYDLFVSDFALCELSAEVRQEYGDKLMRLARCGAVGWNENAGASALVGAALVPGELGLTVSAERFMWGGA